jgi:hypothetical protein
MTELYRGLLTILATSLNELMFKFRAHIRGFNDVRTGEGTEYDFGVMGFWNLMLEITMDFYVISAKFLGIVLISALAITFYPGFAFLRLLSRSFRGILAEPTPAYTEKHIEPKIEEITPKTDKK